MRKTVIVLACAIVAGMVAYPPWMRILNRPGIAYSKKAAGYHALWNAPLPWEAETIVGMENIRTWDSTSMSVDYGRLGLQIAGVAVATAALCVVSRSSKRPASPS